MRLRALNEDFLWKGRIQRAEYAEPKPKPPMLLPEFNSLTGKACRTNDFIHDDICKRWNTISSDYWKGAKIRREAYREKHTIRVAANVDAVPNAVPNTVTNATATITYVEAETERRPKQRWCYAY
jgi:hypothetical protein